MARSRLEKIGTIYSRTNALITSGAMAFEERPLWFDIYEAFPPKDEPTFGRPAPNMKLKQIFYEEDKIRAKFQRNNKQLGLINMFNNQKTLSQRFIENYKMVEEQYKGAANPDQVYQEAMELLQNSRETSEDVVDTSSLSSTFKEAQAGNRKNEISKIDVKDIFKD